VLRGKYVHLSDIFLLVISSNKQPSDSQVVASSDDTSSSRHLNLETIAHSARNYNEPWRMIMFATLKTTAAAGLGLAMLAGAVTPAAADRSGDIAAGIIGGAIVGGIIGQSTAAPRSVYVEPRPVYRSGGGCRELRERARDAEDAGRYERARRWWNEYRACRGE
jgi:hypothetical protein